MSNVKKGIIMLFAAYFMWGVLPIYWKALGALGSIEILAHRILWSAAAALIYTICKGQWHMVVNFVRSQKIGTFKLMAGGVLISFNWWLYIWAVNDGRILETSLGYFINPLVSMMFGMFCFGEKLSRLQYGAVVLVCGGVAVEVISAGVPPFVSLGLAFSFGLYSVLKKTIAIDPMAGLLIETLTVTPPALLWLIHLQTSGLASFPYSAATTLLLAGTGIITTIPLALFAVAMRHVPLTTVGFVQYLSPSITFIIGNFIYHEAMPPSRLAAFAFIWAALCLYTFNAAVNISPNHVKTR